MLDTCVILQLVWIVGVLGSGGVGGGGEGKVKPFYNAKTMTREGRGCLVEKMQF